MGNALLIDGTNVENFPGVYYVGLIDGFWAPGERRGDDDVIPGVNGEQGARLPFAKYLITIPMWIRGTSQANLNTHLADIGDLVRSADTYGLVQLVRHIDNGSGFDTHTAQGRFAAGLNFTVVNERFTVRTDLQVYNLSGAWNTGSDWIVP